MRFLSPLRYPGGKGLLLKFVRPLVDAMDPAPTSYIEPFAGGAAIALGLLHSGAVPAAIIGDADPAVAAFWQAALDHPGEFAEAVRSCDVNLDTWHEQAHLLRTADPTDVVALGFAAFFLNRTNRSGILRARPIGGLKQDGPYPLDCRFNKSDLIRRLELVAQLSERITIHAGDAIDLLDQRCSSEADETFVYADPPYLTKSTDLYLDTMSYSKHQLLAKKLNSGYRRWIVSYDCDAKVADDLYPDNNILQFGLRHSAAKPHRGHELMALSSAVQLTDETRLLHRAIWHRRVTPLHAAMA